MKKILKFTILLLSVLTLTSCSKDEKQKLFILNSGDFMDLNLVDKFEKEFNCEVIYEEVPSNEEMYTKLKSGITKYDLVFPSDYMLDKMILENLLQEIDYDIVGTLDGFIEKSLDVIQVIDPGNKYSLPYSWGTLGIMYDLDYEKEVLENGYAVLFEDFPTIKNVGMYNSSRDAVASALLYLGYNVNTTNEDELKKAEEALLKKEYTTFADDSLKTSVSNGNLDVALVYSGDYLGQAYINLEDGVERTYGYFAPDVTNLWVDVMAIPKTSQNPHLANEFIKFISEYENALQNTKYIGYAPVLKDVFNTISKDESLKGITDQDNFNPNRPGFDGQVYTYEGQEHYEILDDILVKVKSKY